MTPFTEAKFAELSLKQRHRHAALLLRAILENQATLSVYEVCAKEFNLPFPQNREEMCHRFHYHLKEARFHLSEGDFLCVRKFDQEEGEPFLPIDIYLDHLRSAHNVGSIIRTAEAFRIGEIYLGGTTPTLEKEKLAKTSMGAQRFVPCHPHATLFDLKKKPLIALETVEGSLSIDEYLFPESFSLILGNEEYGVSEEALQQADIILQIPLYGAKNSLNVAAAFAITCAAIRRSRLVIVG